ncbi:MAG: hypothetical protein O9292_02080 [Rhodobacteraceae bacterium]|jgi:hypothetical protein|nr:hypothetical protein [Paracoccaceae bacterium]
MPPNVDPRLLHALSDDAPADELLDVVLRFDLPAPPAIDALMPLAERRQRRASTLSGAIEQVLERAAEATGTQPVQVTPFPLTSSAYVKARKSYLRALLARGDVAAAMLNSG